MTQIPEEINYKEAYEKEHLKSAALASRVAELEEKNDLLEFKLNRIKTNPLWVHTTGLRKIMHTVLRQTTRVKNCGGVISCGYSFSSSAGSSSIGFVSSTK